jgi:Leucine-rich repeat (LRR) protein
MTSVSRCSSCSQLAKFVDNHCYKIGSAAVVTGAIAATLYDPSYAAASSAIAATGVIASIAKYMKGPSPLQGRVTDPSNEPPPLVDLLPAEDGANPQNLILLYQKLEGPRCDDDNLLKGASEIWHWMNESEQQNFLQKVTTLNLSDLELTALPSVIGLLPNITELYLSDNKLKVLPPEIGQLTALQRLSLDNNELEALPPEIGRLTALVNLGLENNNLKALPPEIGRLTALEDLDLENNNLKALPPEIGRLTALKDLDLENNNLKALPPEIGRLTALKLLSLEGNLQLVAFPPEIGQLAALQRLSLESNLLKTLPQELRREGLVIIESDNIPGSDDEEPE